MRIEKRKILTVIITLMINIILDRLTKWFAVFYLKGKGPLRPGILNVAALSVTFGVIAFIVYEFISEKKRKAV